MREKIVSSSFKIDWEIYDRFHVNTEMAPNRKKIPHPFNPIISKIGLTKHLLRELKEHKWRIITSQTHRHLFFAKPCIYGVFSGPLAGYKPRKQLCTGCLRCVLEYPEFCRVERNPAFYEFGDSYWVPKDSIQFSMTPAFIVWNEAETGKIPIKGMGYKGPFARDGWDEIWTDMSEIVRPTRDGIYGREYISTLVDLGRKPPYLKFSDDGRVLSLARTVQASLPVIFDHLPLDMNNASIALSIRGAAEHVKTFFIMTPEHAELFGVSPSPWMVPLIAMNEVNRHSKWLKNARMIEMMTDDPLDLSSVRALNDKAPVIARMRLTRNVKDRVLELVDEGVDGIHLLADYHGKEFSQKDARFIKDALHDVHLTLVQEGLRDEVTLIASGGIILAEHVPKAIIMGADAVAIDTAILVALQVQFQGECISPETGKIIQETFSHRWGTQRLINLLGSWHDQLIEILSAMGQRDVRRLRGDVGRALFRDELEKDAFGEIEIQVDDEI